MSEWLNDDFEEFDEDTELDLECDSFDECEYCGIVPSSVHVLDICPFCDGLFCEECIGLAEHSCEDEFGNSFLIDEVLSEYLDGFVSGVLTTIITEGGAVSKTNLFSDDNWKTVLLVSGKEEIVVTSIDHLSLNNEFYELEYRKYENEEELLEVSERLLDELDSLGIEAENAELHIIEKGKSLVDVAIALVILENYEN